MVEPEEFLAGVLGFTEELSRYAVQKATARDLAAVQGCRDVVDAILGQFLQFDLRNSALRRKYDGLKYTLKKLEVGQTLIHLPEPFFFFAPCIYEPNLNFICSLHHDLMPCCHLLDSQNTIYELSLVGVAAE